MALQVSPALAAEAAQAVSLATPAWQEPRAAPVLTVGIRIPYPSM